MGKMIQISRCLRAAIKKAPMAGGPLQAPTNLNNLHFRNWAKVISKAAACSLTMSLVWIWTIRIPNSEHTMDYLKHVDLKERGDAMKEWGVFPSHPANGKRPTLLSFKKVMMTMMTNKCKN